MDRILRKDLNQIVEKRIKPRLLYEMDTGCWIWTGYCNQSGYGRLAVRKRMIGYCKAFYVHRLMYLWQYGKIDWGKEVMHKCNRTTCCNPLHLELGTKRENVQEMWRRRRGQGMEVEEEIMAKFR